MIQFNNKPPKKLVVKNLKNKPKISEEYEATALARISSTIDSVFKDEPLPYGHESIYRSCETLCKFHLASSVYRTLYEKCEREARTSADFLVKECNEIIDEVEYLKKFEVAWESFQRHYNLLESLFLYLDKVYISQQQSTQFIHVKRFGINFFRSYSLMNSVNLGREMIEKLMKLIERIREESIQSGELYELCKKLVGMIRELEEYSQGELEFENVFIQRTWTFYEKESEIEASRLVISEYLKYSWERLEYEDGIVSSFLAPITREKLIKCVRDRLILDRMAFLFPKPIGSSFNDFFNNKDKKSMKLIYELVNGVFGVLTLASEFTAFLRLHGQELMGKGNDYRTIERVASFKEQVDEIMRECFQSDPVMQGTLKDAFESIMNGRGERSAELLALYVHHKLISCSSSSELACSEPFLSMSLLLFRYLHCKEAFDAFYKRTLAQRLLFHGHGNDLKKMGLERQFIGKLREECGGGFVSRMESMLKDVEQSADMTKQFKSGITTGIASVTGITVISGLWPNTASSSPSPSDALIKSMPSELTRLEASFSNFYTGQRKNCSLKWNELMGNCVMRATFPSGRHNLNLSIPQALILLKFTGNSSTIDKLSQELNMDRELVDATLKSLSSPLYPVLRAAASSSGVYEINEEFDYKGEGKVPLYALQSPFLPGEEEIPGLLGGSGPESPELPPSAIPPAASLFGLSAIQDRQLQVDSMLVRRMKHQSRSNRKDLVNYVLANLGNLRVSAGDVDNRIEELIEKEYMKMGDDSETLLYLA